MLIHTMEVWKPSVRHIPASQIFRTGFHFMSIQTTKPPFLTQRSKMLPAQYIPILTNLPYCFPNQFLTHFFQLYTLSIMSTKNNIQTNSYKQDKSLHIYRIMTVSLNFPKHVPCVQIEVH